MWGSRAFNWGAGGKPYGLVVALAPLAFLFAIPWLAREYNNGDAPGTFLERHAAAVFPEDLVISSPYMAPAICWYYKRHDVFMLEDSGEMRYGLSYPHASDD